MVFFFHNKKNLFFQSPKIFHVRSHPNMKYYCYIIYHLETNNHKYQNNIHLNFPRSPVWSLAPLLYRVPPIPSPVWEWSEADPQEAGEESVSFQDPRIGNHLISNQTVWKLKPSLNVWYNSLMQGFNSSSHITVCLNFLYCLGQQSVVYTALRATSRPAFQTLVPL